MYAAVKAAAKALKREVLALYYAIQDERTPLLAKVLPWLVIAYALSPLDLIPDFIPLLGLLDDLVLLPALIWLALKLIPKQVLSDARQRAELEPLLLARNWLIAILIFLLWMAGIEASIFYAIRAYGTPECRQYMGYIMGAVAAAGSIAFVVWFVLGLRREAREQLASKLAAQQQADAVAASGGDYECMREPLIGASA